MIDRNIESSYLMHLDAINLYGLTMSQKVLINGFEWAEELSEFDERFIKNYYNNSGKGYFLEVDVENPKNLFNLHRNLSFFTSKKEN